MGKLAVLLVLAAAGVAVLHGSASGDGLREGARHAGERQRLALAQTAAKTGWAQAKQALAAAFESDTLVGTNGGAAFEARVVVAGSEAVVTSTGRAPIPGRAATTDYQIVYRLRAEGGGLPAFAERALAVDGDLEMSGNGSIVTPGVAGSGPDVRIHANGSLRAASGSAVVEGFGTYTTAATGKITNTFRPRSNPNDEPELARADSVAIPEVVPSEVVSSFGGATAVYAENPSEYWDAELREPLPGGTRDDPAVYYVRGNVLIVNMVVDGYAVFVADGQVKVGGSLRGKPEAGRDESAIAIFTPADVVMKGGADARASIVAGGGLGYNGNVDIYGSLAVGGDLDHGGGAVVHYVPAAPGLFRPWATGGAGLRLLGYREM